MSEQEEQQVRDAGVPSPAVRATDGTASPEAARRLADAMSERTDAYRLRTSVELSLIDAMVQMGAEGAASAALDDYAQILKAYARDIESALAAATVEREAEQVVSSLSEAAELEAAREVIGTDRTADTVPARPVWLDAEGEDALDPAPGRTAFRPVRRLVGSAVGAAAIALVLAVPAWRTPDDGPQLTAAELSVQQDLMEARYRLAALSERPAPPREVTSEAAALHGQILALSDRTLEREVVRHELRLLLDTERQALEDVADRAPEARSLINEIHAIRRSLDLDEPGVPDPEPTPDPDPDLEIPTGVELPEPVDAPVDPPAEPPTAAEVAPEPPPDDRRPVLPAPKASAPPEVDDPADGLDDAAVGEDPPSDDLRAP